MEAAAWSGASVQGNLYNQHHLNSQIHPFSKLKVCISNHCKKGKCHNVENEFIICNCDFVLKFMYYLHSSELFSGAKSHCSRSIDFLERILWAAHG